MYFFCFQGDLQYTLVLHNVYLRHSLPLLSLAFANAHHHDFQSNTKSIVSTPISSNQSNTYFNTNKKMSTQAAQLLEQQLFTTLKTQIVGLATPLYGTRSEDASKVYDVITYSMDLGDGNNNNDSGGTFNTASTNSDEDKARSTYGVALVLYTGPSSSPFTSWTLTSHVENQLDIITGAVGGFKEGDGRSYW